MPRTGEQRKLGDFFSTPAPKATKSKHKTKKTKINDSPVSVISLDSGESDSDGQDSKLAPSSQNTFVTEQNEGDSDKSEGPVEQSPRARRLRRLAAARVVSDVDTSGSDDHVPLNLLGKRKIDDSEEQLQSPNKKRKTLVKGLKPAAEEENLTEELDKDVILDRRFRPMKKSTYSKNLERLQRERQGLSKKTSRSSSSQENSDDSENTISEGEVGPEFKPIPGARNPNVKSTNLPDPADDDSVSSSGNTDDFIDDDEDEDAVGCPDLPIQFSMIRVQPLAVSFKVFFQFLVHVACQPPHLREAYMNARLSDTSTADYFKNAVNHLQKTLGSIRDSQVASTIWKAQFREALEDFPELDMVDIEVEPYCHACRKNAARSTRQVKLSGRAYNKMGFEPLEESSEDEEDGDEDSSSSESSEEAPLETFNLGQQCARRVSLFHAFAHWEYNLFKAIEEEIAGFETQNRERLLKKKKKKHVVDTDDPDHILELLDKKRVIDQRWKEIQDMMERAKKIETRAPGEID